MYIAIKMYMYVYIFIEFVNCNPSLLHFTGLFIAVHSQIRSFWYVRSVNTSLLYWLVATSIDIINHEVNSYWCVQFIMNWTNGGCVRHTLVYIF